MIRSRWILCAAAFGGAVLLVAGLWLLRPRSPINEDAFGKIEKGMTLSQVETLLGGPPRDESKGMLLAHLTQDEAEWVRKKGLSEEQFAADKVHWSRLAAPATATAVWVSDTAVVVIIFDNDSTVSEKRFTSVYRKYDGLWPTIQRWLRL